jgi:hypothetical protein
VHVDTTIRSVDTIYMGCGDEVRISPEEQELFRKTILALREAEVPFLMAGAYALFKYSGCWRNTKDLDILVLPEARERAIEAVCAIGLEDYFDREPYDREWIFRGNRGDVIVDLIWRLANKAGYVEGSWFDRATDAVLLDLPVKVVGPSELCWMKLFVVQRRRCDWPDILNVIRGTAGRLDWEDLFHHVGEHWHLLAGVIHLFDWVCPNERHYIPREVRDRLITLAQQELAAGCRADLLDARPWLTQPGAGLGSELNVPYRNNGKPSKNGK